MPDPVFSAGVALGAAAVLGVSFAAGQAWLSRDERISRARRRDDRRSQRARRRPAPTRGLVSLYVPPPVPYDGPIRDLPERSGQEW